MTYQKFRDIAILVALTFAALLVHGYHPGAEDAAIYLPGIKKDLNPSLYPFGSEFFTSHAGMTLFDEVIAGSVRLTHVSLETAMLVWQLASIFFLLYACRSIARLCFRETHEQWAAVTLVAALLTLPATATALLLMDPYLTPRSLSTPAVVFAIACAMKRRHAAAAAWLAFAAVVHPLMFVFGLTYIGTLALLKARWFTQVAGTVEALPKPIIASVSAFLPLLLSFRPASGAYRVALMSRPYFFLKNWAWYEWIGVFAPLLLLWIGSGLTGGQVSERFRQFSRALVFYGLLFLGAGLILTVPECFQSIAELQPMRGFHLLYILFFVLLGGLLGKYVLGRNPARWIAVYLSISGLMFAVQRNTFPGSPHIEWPGRAPVNAWARAFQWIRNTTPRTAIFALDPNHMSLPGEDHQGFRGLAERSMLADNYKDSGAVTMFPALAKPWREQVDAMKGWEHFESGDLHKLSAAFGVNWVVLRKPGIHGLTCPYQNEELLVCRVD